MWLWSAAGTGSRDGLQSEKCFALTILDGSGSSEYQRATWTSVLTVWQKEWDVLVLIKALFSWSEAPGTQRAWQPRKSSCPGVYKLKQAIQVGCVWIFSLHSQVLKCFVHKQECSTFPRNHTWSGLSCRRSLGVEDWIYFPDPQPYLHRVKWALYLPLSCLLTGRVKGINTSLPCLDKKIFQEESQCDNKTFKQCWCSASSQRPGHKWQYGTTRRDVLCAPLY